MRPLRLVLLGGGAPCFPYRERAAPGLLDGTVTGAMQGGDDYAVSFVYSISGSGVLRLRAESDVREPGLELAVWLEGGQTWVLVHQSWKAGVGRGVRLSARFAPGERLPAAPQQDGKPAR